MKTNLFLARALVLGCLGLGLAAQGSTTADFRVLPYQMNPALDGIQLTWFTVTNTPGAVAVTGPGLAAPLTLPSTPALAPALDYQIAGELNATGAFPFATTAVFEAPAVNIKETAERLRRGYFLRWVLAPTRLDPETKMPKYADAEGMTQLTDILDGKGTEQFDAVRQYLRTLEAK